MKGMLQKENWQTLTADVDNKKHHLKIKWVKIDHAVITIQHASSPTVGKATTISDSNIVLIATQVK